MRKTSERRGTSCWNSQRGNGGSRDRPDRVPRCEPDGRLSRSSDCATKGVQVLADGLAFGFRSPDYRITATPASEWLILLLEAGGEGMEITLWEVMDFGDFLDGDVAIQDDHGNTYRLGYAQFCLGI